MVSPLWKAASDGDLQSVLQILQDTSGLDIDIKDDNGVTPLFQAVRNGHVEIVRTLLDKGADPNIHGRPQGLTSDPTIVELLSSAQQRNLSSSQVQANNTGYTHDATGDVNKAYYPHPMQVAYPYYTPVPHGAVTYYPTPPPSTERATNPSGYNNLPPAEVARYIPCRYFPACRYGATCIFLHPQGPYFPAPPPTSAPYSAPYDPAQQPYPPNYYPPSFAQSSTGSPGQLNPASPLSDPQNQLSPVQQPISPTLSPTGPPPMPYGAMAPMPPPYPPPGQMPLNLAMPPLAQLHRPPPQGPQTNPTLYTLPPPAPPYPLRSYPAQAQNGHAAYAEKAAPVGKTLQHRHEARHSPPASAPATMTLTRDGPSHGRRGNGRKTSYGGRKMPCLFFPWGRCRNGDDCRFPHIVSEGGQAPSRSGYRARGGINGQSMGSIEEKLADMSLKDDGPRANGTATSSRSQSTEMGGRPRYGKGHTQSGSKGDKKGPTKPQRVPGADEFPVLGGSTTPPSRGSGPPALPNGHTGPTAAQILSAPPPARVKEAKECSRLDAEVNSMSDASHETVAKAAPVSFATIASPVHDVANQVSVSA